MTRARSVLVLFALLLFATASLAQTPDRRQPASPSAAPEQSNGLPANSTRTDVVANEIGLLRKSVTTLNLRLREITDKVLATGAGVGSSTRDTSSRLALSLEILTRAEQRAEALRRELLERIERETSLRSRLAAESDRLHPQCRNARHAPPSP